MRQAELREIGSFSGVVGYWQFAGESGNHLAAVERDEDAGAARLRVFSLRGDRWEQVKTVPLPQPLAKAADGTRIDRTVFVCLEVNDVQPLELWSADYGALVSPSEQVSLRRVRRLGLSADAMQSVRVPAARQWHAQLRVPAWLFDPHLVRGGPPGLGVVASTADGQVALARGEGTELSLGTAPALRNALGPQAVLVDREVMVAALRPSEDSVFPFWILPRYSGPPSPPTGELIVRHGAQPELNLSAVIGPVSRFALATGDDGRPWLFALVDAPVGTDVVALERQADRWAMRGRQNLTAELRDVAVEAAGGRWHLVYAGGTGDRTTLYYQPWRISAP